MSRLPDAVRRGVAEALEAAGRAPDIVDERDVGGGCINRAVRLRTGDGSDCFLKWNEGSDPRMFTVEADGLRALAATATLRVPDVVGVGDPGASGPGWLLLEYVDPGHPTPGYGPALGRGLAALHRSGGHASSRARAADPGSAGAAPAARGQATADAWGWEEDNFIGSLPQTNAPCPGWADFWRDRRLEPQLRQARDGGFLAGRGGRDVEAVLDRVATAVAPAEEDGPSLLHGDLWGGNVYADEAGAPVLIDPAVYRGHREVDLAMSELFGGFPADFYDAYADAWPLADGYAEVRRPLYQLYYLLVHVNLFGSAYEGRTAQAARAVLRAA